MSTSLVNQRLFKLLLAVLLLILAAASFAQPEPIRASNIQSTIPSPDQLKGCGGAVFNSSEQSFEDELVQLVNEIRQSNNLLPFKRMESLSHSARFHATDMSEENYFSHTSHDRMNGELVPSCGWTDRIQTYYTGWSHLGENLGAGQSTPQQVLEGWMSSKSHRENILSTEYWEMGVGYFKGNGPYVHYWVQEFGRRKGVYPVVINGDATTTDDGMLTIQTYGEWDEMRLRVDQNNWEAWRPFASKMDWTLKALAGEHTIAIEMRNSSEHATATDSIRLTKDTAQPDLTLLPDTLMFSLGPVSSDVLPGFYAIEPLSLGGNPAYSWQAVTNAPWLVVSPTQGGGAEELTVKAVIADVDKALSDLAILTISLEKNGKAIAEKEIIVFLDVRKAQFLHFVPMISRR